MIIHNEQKLRFVIMFGLLLLRDIRATPAHRAAAVQIACAGNLNFIISSPSETPRSRRSGRDLLIAGPTTDPTAPNYLPRRSHRQCPGLPATTLPYGQGSVDWQQEAITVMSGLLGTRSSLLLNLNKRCHGPSHPSGPTP